MPDDATGGDPPHAPMPVLLVRDQPVIADLISLTFGHRSWHWGERSAFPARLDEVAARADEGAAGV
jgi:hypothetical protein